MCLVPIQSASGPGAGTLPAVGNLWNKGLAWFRSCHSMTDSTIDGILLVQGVESNPGPNPNPKPNLSVRTYNCNGLGNTDKFRRVLIKF